MTKLQVTDGKRTVKNFGGFVARILGFLFIVLGAVIIYDYYRHPSWFGLYFVVNLLLILMIFGLAKAKSVRKEKF
ncbi:MAG: hypothetical protein PHS44_05780 [Candidatus Dojkabacteria bacterium]|nr:hypothetical protein [Candidatus Dojkabacteria bacterium]